MRYYCEDIMSIFLIWKENLSLQGLFTVNYKSNKRNQSKEMKSILNVKLIDISYVWIQIFCPQFGHMDRDCDSLGPAAN